VFSELIHMPRPHYLNSDCDLAADMSSERDRLVETGIATELVEMIVLARSPRARLVATQVCSQPHALVPRLLVQNASSLCRKYVVEK
jgi:hypothetical protein